ncbi:NAC domain-containing protein 17-like isoform X1 [Asparagus officinalis]|uniref:NAC domain-containing protein 17-like isoform X1 n=1 Tax=Asparagus officinalis TaxID=4686 RepID=UPI00098E231F|nr:NAC domain-containing protein 17-like isoform X1 [Asparagus officinalis]
MHEYTIDEKVLERCSSVQDYFALYKLFRKSGPGPKNGEQYGAPFREEEWEEDFPDDNFMNHINMGDQSKEHPQFQSVDRVSNVVGERLPNYDVENMLLQMSDEQDVVPQHSECYSLNDDARVDNPGSGTDKCMQTTEHIQNHSVNRIVNEDTNTLSNFHLEDILLQMSNELDVAPEANITVNPLSYQDDLFIQQTDAEYEHGSVMTSFQNTSAAANVQPIEMPKMTSLTGSSVQGQDIADEEFLEIKDLNDLDSLNWGTEEISNNDHIPVSGGLIDTDDYFDAQMFLAEATGPGHIINQNSWWDDFGGNGRHSQASHLTTEFWTEAQSHNASTAVVPSSASSGLAYANDNQPDDGLTLGEMNNVGTPSESWFNSALLAFLDSVPSSPALASENTLISRALERVSSFRTGQTQEAGGLPATKVPGFREMKSFAEDT